MPLLALPVEIIVQIASYSRPVGFPENFKNLNSFARTCRRLYTIVDPFLYSLDAKLECYGRLNSGLCHAARHGLLGTAQKAFQAGAEAYDTMPTHRHE